MTQQTKRPNLLPYLLVLLVLVGVYGFMNKPVEAEPSYAEVRELFESEQVSAFTVTDTTLRMKLREPIDGKTELKKDLFSVTLFYDDLGELIEQQKADGIIEDYDFTADHSINYVAMFAPYILAVLGIFAIWYFLSIRSAGGGGSRNPGAGIALPRRIRQHHRRPLHLPCPHVGRTAAQRNRPAAGRGTLRRAQRFSPRPFRFRALQLENPGVGIIFQKCLYE